MTYVPRPDDPSLPPYTPLPRRARPRKRFGSQAEILAALVDLRAHARDVASPQHETAVRVLADFDRHRDAGLCQADALIRALEAHRPPRDAGA